MTLEEALAYAIQSPDEREGRVYGWLAGVVTDIDTKLMRVKARIGKQSEGDSTDWLVPVSMGSIESLPELNDPIGVIFMDGDPNRGAYFCYPQTTTKDRPTKEPVPLGLTFVGMFNFLVTQFNQLRADFNNHGHGPGSYVTPVGGGLVTGVSTAAKGIAADITPGAVPSDPISGATSAKDGVKGKAADGTVVSDKSSSEIVLSKRTKVR